MLKKLAFLYVFGFIIGMLVGIVLHFTTPNSLLLDISYLLFVLLFIQMGFLLFFSFKSYKKQKPRKLILNNESVSVIMPCYNEGKVLKNAVESMIKQNYDNFDIAIVDDGSTDNTKSIGLAMQAKYPFKVRFFSKINGGKASALNYGITHTKGEILVCMDADAVFTKNGINELVESLKPKNVGAVCGNVKVANRCNILTKSQGSEYITAWGLQARTFSELGCLQVISGVMGAFKRKAMEDVGYFSTDTIVEDMDITLALQKNKWDIAFNNNAVGYVESPENIGDWYKQRYRWAYGKYECLKKYKTMLFNSEYGPIGTIGLPYYIFASFTNIIMVIFTSILLIYSITTGKLPEFALYISMMAVIPIFMQAYTIFIDGNNENYSYTLFAIIQNLWYPYFITYVDTKAFYNHYVGKKATWNKINRLGKNKI